MQCCLKHHSYHFLIFTGSLQTWGYVSFRCEHLFNRTLWSSVLSKWEFPNWYFNQICIRQSFHVPDADGMATKNLVEFHYVVEVLGPDKDNLAYLTDKTLCDLCKQNVPRNKNRKKQKKAEKSITTKHKTRQHFITFFIKSILALNVNFNLSLKVK